MQLECFSLTQKYFESTNNCGNFSLFLSTPDSSYWSPVMAGTLIAVITYITTQLLTQLIFKPAEEFYWIRGKLAEKLLFYEDVYSNPPTDQKRIAYEKMQDEFREFASQLIGCSYQIKFLHLWLPSKAKIQDAAAELIGLSNSSGHDYKENRAKAEKIRNQMSLV